MENESKKSKIRIVAKFLGLLAVFVVFGAALSYIKPVENLFSMERSSKASFTNSAALKAEAPEGDFGPQTLYYMPSLKRIEIAPVQVQSLQECFDTAQAEMRRLIAEGNNETFFGPRCKDEDTGNIVVIGN